ncbi:MAG: nucleotidyltransferase domain-containing protein [Chloroflexi bacterium]|nr:nucleotidyltransferase domain-containing protein [Chloroflexota bacterium]
MVAGNEPGRRVRDWSRDHPRLLAFLAERLRYSCVFATLSGGDLYGFPGEDSDYDLRGVHLLPLRAVLISMLREGGMDRIPGLTLEAKQAHPAPEIDYVSHDLGKFLRLALKGNGYVLEQLLSPLVVATSEIHAELKTLAPGLITRRLYYHYRGFFAQQEKLYNNVGAKRVKGLLYQYRVPMTGIVALETGQIEANLLRLNERFRLAGVNELVTLKVGGEAAFLHDDAPYLAEIAPLEPLLDQAFERSRLPDHPTPETRAAAEALLVKCRMLPVEAPDV